MRAAFLGPAVALQFLTILPVRLPATIPTGSFPNAVATFPLVGLVIGVLVATFDAAIGGWLPVSIGAAIDVLVLAVLTGGLHLDGLADAADGLLGNLPRERRLAVMREGGIGAFGAVALVVTLLAEYGALVSLDPATRFIALVGAVVLSRWSMSLLLGVFPYVHASGAGSAFKSGLQIGHLIVASAFAFAIAIGLGSFFDLVLMAVAAIVALVVGWLARSRIGGCTGDVFGAGGELAFAATLIGAVALR